MQGKKYDINNFYVGELYLSKELEGLTYTGIVDSKKSGPLLENGAIRIEKEKRNKYVDLKKGLEYEGFLTLFYKQGFNYICLHNGKVYSLLADDFAINLVPIKDIIPKVDNKVKNKISVNQALEIFDILLGDKDKNLKKLYVKNTHDSSLFLVGDLNVCYMKDQGHKFDFFDNYTNLTFNYLLDDELLKGYVELKEDKFKTTYLIYKSLFFKNDSSSKLLSLNTNQYYEDKKKMDTSYYSDVISFDEYLKEKKKPVVRKLTIPKALDLLKENK